MRLDEMIIKAKEDGKTYINNGYKVPAVYSAKTGFTYDGEPWTGEYSMAYITGWEELPKRHLTVAEAEKELACVIDVPDISKLYKAMSEKPDNKRNVIIIDKASGFTHNFGFYDKDEKWWRWFSGCNPCISNPSLYFWIDPADLIKLLPKE